MTIEVRPVGSRRDLREFLALPFRLHSNAPQWCPPLLIERRFYLSRRFNPFFKHGDAQLFLAERDGRVVGRISAQYDDNFNSFHKAKWGWFGFLELDNDPEIMSALLSAAEAWNRERGMERMVGPADLTMNEESGIVVEGFDLPAFIRQPWQPPYYQRLAEGAGLDKAMDLLMWNLEVQDRDKVLPIMFELAENAESEHGVVLRKMKRRHLRKEMDRFAEVYNAAWKDNWGFVPYSKEDLDQYAQEMQLVYAREWFMVAEKDGDTVGMAITVPDLNQVLKRMNGRLLPLGWWHFVN